MSVLYLSTARVRALKEQGIPFPVGDNKRPANQLDVPVLEPSIRLTNTAEGWGAELTYRAYWHHCAGLETMARGQEMELGKGSSARRVILESITCTQIEGSPQARVSYNFVPKTRGERSAAEQSNTVEPRPGLYADVRITHRTDEYPKPIYERRLVSDSTGQSYTDSIFAVDAPSTGKVYQSVLVGTSTIQRVWRQWQITLWEPEAVDNQINPNNGQVSPLINQTISRRVPGYRTYTGICRDAASAPAKTTGWINTYTLESATPIYQVQIKFDSAT